MAERDDSLDRDPFLLWTAHARMQMRQYGVSPQKVRQIIAYPTRTEQAIAPGTTQAMQPFGSPTKNGRQPYRGEIWVMYQKNANREAQSAKQQKTIISVWKYPGVSKEREGIPEFS